MNRAKIFIHVLHKNVKEIVGGILYFLLLLVVMFGVVVYATLSILLFLVNDIKDNIINGLKRIFFYIR